MDKGDVLRAYRDWPSLAEKGFETHVTLPDGSFKRACVMGMGGSAAGGDIISGWLAAKPGIDFAVYKGSLPGVNMRGTLALACSASGQTAETIEMAKTANSNGATVVCISSGGRLEEVAKSLGLRHLKMPPLVAPRYMLPFIVFSCLAAANRGLGLGCEDDALAAIHALSEQAESLDVGTPMARNEAKKLARQIMGKTPAILCDEVSRGVGIRFKSVLNENAKTHAYVDIMPDLFHNEIEAWEGRDGPFTPVFLRHSAEKAQDRGRTEIMKGMLRRIGSTPLEVRGRGRGLLSQLVTMAYLLDMTSYYLAVALGRDPLSTGLIDLLKKSGGTSVG